jgi:Rod binding domain-containing protein
MIPIGGVGGAGAATGAASGPDPRLKPAAHEFEACLMKEFLEPLQKDPLFAEEKDGASAEGSGNALMSFGSEALARAISERGGFGIAAKILEHFATTKGQASGSAVSKRAGDSGKI